MDAVYVGWLSILPPMIAIILALITKEVLFSLIAGVLSGTLIYSIASGMNPIVGPVSTVFDVMIQKTDMNIIIFCFLLGGLVYLINASGGAQAYGKWASKIIRTKRSSLLLTSLLGCLIFLDDYFNCLTVGTVMKPITDRHHVSRAKLAYIIDATAAPICIIAPISSWAAAVGSYLKNTGAFDSEFKAFITAIPYNFYAILSLLMVFLLCVFSLDFGPMAKQEVLAERGFLGGLDEQKDSLAQPKSGRVADMIVPILVLIVTAILPGALLPALVFILAAFLSFSTGTSWGTFGILIPIIIPVAQSICPELLLSSLAATLAGSVFGDHCSPISDTTILSSAGAGVNHLTHVSTQMIYALTVAGCSLIGYLIIGITNGNLLLSLGTSIFILCIFTFIMHRRSKTILNKKDICSTQ